MNMWSQCKSKHCEVGLVTDYYNLKLRHIEGMYLFILKIVFPSECKLQNENKSQSYVQRDYVANMPMHKVLYNIS
jgi:hypothetical protein